MRREPTSVLPEGSPAVSVVICAYTDRRWELLAQTIDSVVRQERAADEILLVVDHNPDLIARAEPAFAGVRILANEDTRGLSGARNTGVRHSRGDIIAFLDDDATARPDWLKLLVAAFEDPTVMGAGGFVRPAWDGPAPSWLPQEFLWVVGASYAGLPDAPAPVRNPIGANMAFRRQAFERAGGFTAGIGRLGTRPMGCEETEFSIRLRQVVPGARIVHVPDARVDHHVPAERATRRYFVARCWAEGASKAQVTSQVGDTDGLSSERSYVRRTLPRGLLAGLRATAHGDRGGLARSAMIVAGLSVTTAGFATARLGSRSRFVSERAGP
jgi:GT2 family glycosyltransferase